MRVLDLGCGKGIPLDEMGVAETDEVIGVDIDPADLETARSRFPNRAFVEGKGENLSFLEENSVDRVIAEVSLPYMNIPRALAEIHRILKPGGSGYLSLHSLRFTLRELTQTALPKPIPSIYRLYVILNGAVFFFSAKTFRFSRKRIESFQTNRGIEKALQRAGFANIRFTRAGMRFVVEAVKR